MSGGSPVSYTALRTDSVGWYDVRRASCLVWSFLLQWPSAAPALGPLRACPDDHRICPARPHGFDRVEGAFYCERAKIGCH